VISHSVVEKWAKKLENHKFGTNFDPANLFGRAPKILKPVLDIVQELRAIYLLEMTKCLTGIFGKGLPWDIQNRTS